MSAKRTSRESQMHEDACKKARRNQTLWINCWTEILYGEVLLLLNQGLKKKKNDESELGVLPVRMMNLSWENKNIEKRVTNVP